MQLRKAIQRKLQRAGGGIAVDSDLNAVVAANIGERGAVTKVSSEQPASTGSKPSEPSEPERTDPA
jgi:hypothetical protein